MAWLKNRRRTLDIVSEASEDGTRNIDSMNEGLYNLQDKSDYKAHLDSTNSSVSDSVTAQPDNENLEIHDGDSDNNNNDAIESREKTPLKGILKQPRNTLDVETLANPSPSDGLIDNEHDVNHTIGENETFNIANGSISNDNNDVISDTNSNNSTVTAIITANNSIINSTTSNTDENNNNNIDDNNNDRNKMTTTTTTSHGDTSDMSATDITDGLTDNIDITANDDDAVFTDAPQSLIFTGTEEDESRANSCSNLEEIITEEDDLAMQQAFMNSGRSQTRYSLDSRMPGLLKTPSKMRSASHNSSFNSICEGDELEDSIARKPRKSISWAEDLESIREFEKVKPRRLSLVGFLKKL